MTRQKNNRLGSPVKPANDAWERLLDRFAASAGE